MTKKIKKILIVLLMLVVAFWGYVEIINRNAINMSLRQKILKAVYPIFKGFNQLTGKGHTVLRNENATTPPSSFYNLSVMLNNGDTLPLSAWKGKKILLVNTASDCGYTAQYADLQQLFEKHKAHLQVIGFPANDFKEQEKGTDEEIAEFCKVNYGVSFPLVKKSSVIKGGEQHEVFRWLTDKNRNGWNNKPPSWNFTKYLVDENGVLINYFGPSVSPLNNEVISAISSGH
jgi:glutathione peroxidase